MIMTGSSPRLMPTVPRRPFPAPASRSSRGAGHFLPWRNADKFLAILEDFLKSTTPAHVPEERWRKLLTSAPPNDEPE